MIELDWAYVQRCGWRCDHVQGHDFQEENYTPNQSETKRNQYTHLMYLFQTFQPFSSTYFIFFLFLMSNHVHWQMSPVVVTGLIRPARQNSINKILVHGARGLVPTSLEDFVVLLWAVCEPAGCGPSVAASGPGHDRVPSTSEIIYLQKRISVSHSYLQNIVMKPFDQIGPSGSLGKKFLMVRNQVFFSTLDSCHFSFELFNLIDFSFPTVLRCNLLILDILIKFIARLPALILLLERLSQNSRCIY